jgi:spore germination protein
MPTIANHANGSWIPEQTSALLADPDRREDHVEHIVELVTSHGFDGIDIDYEDLTADDRAGFSSFVTELGAELHHKRKILTVTVHPKPSDAGYDQRNLAQDYAAIGAAADQVRVMAYDWHATGSDPGPVAPLDWVRTIVSWTATQIPPDKIVLGIPLYAYDWGPTGDAVALTVPQAEALARDHGQSIQRDPATGSACFDYTAADGTAHRVWLEDAFAADGKVMLAAERGLGGVFLWRLGDVEDQLWDVLPRLSSAIS